MGCSSTIKRALVGCALGVGTLASGCTTMPDGTDRGAVYNGPAGKPPMVLTKDQQLLRQAAAERAAAFELRQLRQETRDAAYREGVQDTLEEFRGRMHGQRGFIYEPPIIERVMMPASIRNGALIPAHEADVIVSPGRWIEQNNVGIPYGRGPTGAMNGPHTQQGKASHRAGDSETADGANDMATPKGAGVPVTRIEFIDD